MVGSETVEVDCAVLIPLDWCCFNWASCASVSFSWAQKRGDNLVLTAGEFCCWEYDANNRASELRMCGEGGMGSVGVDWVRLVDNCWGFLESDDGLVVVEDGRGDFGAGAGLFVLNFSRNFLVLCMAPERCV